LKNGVAVPACAVCHKPVSLEIAKIDEDGQTVHENCYVLRIQREQAVRSQKAGSIRKLSDARIDPLALEARHGRNR
jgi:hypothetical protein